MRVFTVQLPPPGRALPARLIPEGFSIWAFLLGPAWLLRHRAWPFALGAVVSLAVFPWPVWPGIALLCGLCGQDARRVMLQWKGWQLHAVVSGADCEQAELRWLDRQAPPQAPQPC